MDSKGLITGDDNKKRCWWCGTDPLYIHYHDTEWGHPVYDDTRLFEKLCLEGFQAGLSWLTILKKRDNFREAFDGFDIEKVANYDNDDIEKLLKNAGIIRHRGKIEATINNARRAMALRQETDDSLSAYIWSYAPKAKNRPETITYDVARDLTTSPESIALSKDLKKRGWRFVGPTTAYAFMQSMGLVNDHVEGCHSLSHLRKR